METTDLTLSYEFNFTIQSSTYCIILTIGFAISPICECMYHLQSTIKYGDFPLFFQYFSGLLPANIYDFAEGAITLATEVWSRVGLVLYNVLYMHIPWPLPARGHLAIRRTISMACNCGIILTLRPRGKHALWYVILGLKFEQKKNINSLRHRSKWDTYESWNYDINIYDMILATSPKGSSSWPWVKN